MTDPTPAQGASGVTTPPQPVATPAPVAVNQKFARPARLKKRHRVAFLSFFVLVVAPFVAATAYLYTIAQDQYASHVGFSVRSEEAPSVNDLTGLSLAISSSSSSDSNILFEYIQSQRMVRRIQEKVDLEAIYVRPEDPLFGLTPDSSIEDLRTYWNRMIKVHHDSNSGLIELRVLAFTPQDAKTVADAIFAESSNMINELTAIARADTLRYAKDELDQALKQLRAARSAMSEYRVRTQILDPEADIVGRMGLLNSLQNQLASTQIDLDLLNQTTVENDPRITQAERRVRVIMARIAEERDRFSGNGSEVAYADLIGEYEDLFLERDFSEKTYLAALAGYNAKQAEAARQSRYLATYEGPTLSERAEFPQKLLFLSLLTVFLIGAWAIIVLIYYSVRDRR